MTETFTCFEERIQENNDYIQNFKKNIYYKSLLIFYVLVIGMMK